MGSRRLSSITLIVAIVALCFSVGEGLRLTPFPVSASLAPNSQGALDEAPTLSTYSPEDNTYGPIDVRTQHQKRNHRFALEVFGLSANHASELITERVLAFQEFSVTTENELQFAVLSDRAPPFIS
jgi:hypothetical protein